LTHSAASASVRALAVCACGVVAACGDLTSIPEPSRMQAVSAVGSAGDAPFPGDAPDQVAIELSSPDPYTGASNKTGMFARYSHPTVVRATLTGGQLMYTPNFPNIGEAQGPFGPYGRTAMNYWNGAFVVQVIFHSASRHIVFAGGSEVFNVGRDGMGYVTHSGYRPTTEPIFVWCGPIHGVPCFTYAGDAGTITLTRLGSSLSVTAEKTVVEKNETPYFDYRASPMQVEGFSMPFTVDSSHWVPDPVEQGGSPHDVEVHAKDRGACQAQYNPACRRKILGSGTFRLDAWVNGQRFSRSVHVSVNRLKVDIEPPGLAMRTPTVAWVGDKCTAKMIRIETDTIDVTVARAGVPAPGLQVHLTATQADDEGGHVSTAHTPLRPAGGFLTPVGTTDANGKARFVYVRSEFAGRVVVKATLPDHPEAETDEESLNLGYSTFTELPASETYERVGIRAAHPMAHFATAPMVQRLVQLADSMFARGVRVGINDMSLPLGGRFDIGGRWM
jgi:hypothetical protein